MPKDILAIQAEQRILILRDQKVMLDFHLAELYGVETRAPPPVRSTGSPRRVAISRSRRVMGIPGKSDRSCREFKFHSGEHPDPVEPGRSRADSHRFRDDAAGSGNRRIGGVLEIS